VPVTCQVCSAGTAKYTCPGCGVRSCSLGCVQQHKAANGCSGKRDRLGYVPLADYSEKQLLSGEDAPESCLVRHVYMASSAALNQTSVVQGAYNSTRQYNQTCHVAVRLLCIAEVAAACAGTT
jgi:hypothetical protein